MKKTPANFTGNSSNLQRSRPAPFSQCKAAAGAALSGFVAVIEGTCRIVRSEVLEFVRHPAFPLNRRSAESAVEQN